jgi:hypothetical protein
VEYVLNNKEPRQPLAAGVSRHRGRNASPWRPASGGVDSRSPGRGPWPLAKAAAPGSRYRFPAVGWSHAGAEPLARDRQCPGRPWDCVEIARANDGVSEEGDRRAQAGESAGTRGDPGAGTGRGRSRKPGPPPTGRTGRRPTAGRSVSRTAPVREPGSSSGRNTAGGRAWARAGCGCPGGFGLASHRAARRPAGPRTSSLRNWRAQPTGRPPGPPTVRPQPRGRNELGGGGEASWEFTQTTPIDRPVGRMSRPRKTVERPVATSLLDALSQDNNLPRFLPSALESPGPGVSPDLLRADEHTTLRSGESGRWFGGIQGNHRPVPRRPRRGRLPLPHAVPRRQVTATAAFVTGRRCRIRCSNPPQCLASSCKEIGRKRRRVRLWKSLRVVASSRKLN